MKALKGTRPNPMTTLDDLPVEILVFILSFLPTQEAINTSCVSKKWRAIWFLLTSLDFSFEFFFPSSGIIPRPFYASPFTKPFAGYVDRALLSRPSHPPLDFFRLSFIYVGDYSIHVRSWIHSAMTRLQAREVHLDFFVNSKYTVSGRKYDIFFSHLMRNKRLQVLNLINCNLKFPDDIDLGSLRSIFLDRVDLRDEEVRRLVSRCPNLESFELRNCLGVKKLQIRSTRLQKLAFGFITSDTRSKDIAIVIDCPNLSSLSFSDCFCNRFVLKSLQALVEFSVQFIEYQCTSQHYGVWSQTVLLLLQAPNVKKLTGPNLWFNKLLRSEERLAQSFKLQNVNYLELETGYTRSDLLGMAALVERCPNLETMLLQSIYEKVENESIPEELSSKPFKLKAPRIKQVTMRGYYTEEDADKIASILPRRRSPIRFILHRQMA